MGATIVLVAIAMPAFIFSVVILWKTRKLMKETELLKKSQ